MSIHVLFLLFLQPICWAKTFYGSNDTDGGVNLNCLLILIRPGAHMGIHAYVHTDIRMPPLHMQLNANIYVCLFMKLN